MTGALTDWTALVRGRETADEPDALPDAPADAPGLGALVRELNGLVGRSVCTRFQAQAVWAALRACPTDGPSLAASAAVAYWMGWASGTRTAGTVVTPLYPVVSTALVRWCVAVCPELERNDDVHLIASVQLGEHDRAADRLDPAPAAVLLSALVAGLGRARAVLSPYNAYGHNMTLVHHARRVLIVLTAVDRVLSHRSDWDAAALVRGQMALVPPLVAASFYPASDQDGLGTAADTLGLGQALLDRMALRAAAGSSSDATSDVNDARVLSTVPGGRRM